MRRRLAMVGRHSVSLPVTGPRYPESVVMIETTARIVQRCFAERDVGAPPSPQTASRAAKRGCDSACGSLPASGGAGSGRHNSVSLRRRSRRCHTRNYRLRDSNGALEGGGNTPAASRSRTVGRRTATARVWGPGDTRLTRFGETRIMLPTHRGRERIRVFDCLRTRRLCSADKARCILATHRGSVVAARVPVAGPRRRQESRVSRCSCSRRDARSLARFTFSCSEVS